MIGPSDLENCLLFNQSFIEARTRVKLLYQAKLESKLGLHKFSCPNVRELAADLLDNGEYLRTNGTPDPCNDINQLVHEYINLDDRLFLFADFPSKNTICEGNSELFKVNLETDMLSKRRQSENCFEVYKSSCPRSLKIDGTNELFHNYESFLRTAEKFIKWEATNCKEAIIVVNGHGSDVGLEINSEDEPIAWDELFQNLSDFGRKRSVEGHDVPYKLHIVIASCYAHCGSYNTDKDYVLVKTFTGPGYEETITRMKFLPNGRLVDANNVSLNVWAKEYGEKGDHSHQGKGQMNSEKSMDTLRCRKHTSHAKEVDKGLIQYRDNDSIHETVVHKESHISEPSKLRNPITLCCIVASFVIIIIIVAIIFSGELRQGAGYGVAIQLLSMPTEKMQDEMNM